LGTSTPVNGSANGEALTKGHQVYLYHVYTMMYR